MGVAIQSPSRQVLRAEERYRLKLHRKQGIAFQSQATEILYGGAAGGGKSHLFRAAAIAWCLAVPGLQVYFFRRIYRELFDNHMSGPHSFPVLLGPLVESRQAKINWSDLDIEFTNGSAIHLRHCQYPKDVYTYQGAEIHVLIIDELTQWEQAMYRFLRSRLRMVGLTLPLALQGLFPRALCGANPGGIGHNWVKADFVSSAKPFEIHQVAKSEGGMRRQFIPARMEDNPSLMADDPDYESKLEGLGDPALVKAMRSGDWNIVSGGMFDDLWKEDRHVIPAFRIPRSWRVNRAFDWGSSRPYSVGWWAESDGTTAEVVEHGTLKRASRTYPPGSLFRIHELYGWNGRADEGTKELAVEVARKILIEEGAVGPLAGLSVQDGPADSSIFDVENGNSIAKDMDSVGVRWTEADKSPGSRINGAEKMRKYLKATVEYSHDEPHLYVFDQCVHGFIRTVPVLPRDDRVRDDVNTKAEDHVWDETRYRLLELAPAKWGSTPWSGGYKAKGSR
jgi:hypothetical protein